MLEQCFGQRRSWQFHRILRNGKLTLLCLVLTVVVLRGNLGTEKFGTPEQDLKEIRETFSHYQKRAEPRRVLEEVSTDDSAAKGSNKKGIQTSPIVLDKLKKKGIQTSPIFCELRLMETHKCPHTEKDTDGRHPRMKRKHPEEDSIHVSQRFMNNQESQFRNNGYDRNSLPSSSAGTGSTEVSPMETPARVVSQNLRQDDIDPDNMTYELILATKPDAEHGKSPNIVTEDNIKLLFEIQKKIKIRRRAIATVGTELKGFSLHIFIDAL